MAIRLMERIQNCLSLARPRISRMPWSHRLLTTATIALALNPLSGCGGGGGPAVEPPSGSDVSVGWDYTGPFVEGTDYRFPNSQVLPGPNIINVTNPVDLPEKLAFTNPGTYNVVFPDHLIFNQTNITRVDWDYTGPFATEKAYVYPEDAYGVGRKQILINTDVADPRTNYLFGYHVEPDAIYRFTANFLPIVGSRIHDVGWNFLGPFNSWSMYVFPNKTFAFGPKIERYNGQAVSQINPDYTYIFSNYLSRGTDVESIPDSYAGPYKSWITYFFPDGRHSIGDKLARPISDLVIDGPNVQFLPNTSGTNYYPPRDGVRYIAPNGAPVTSSNLVVVPYGARLFDFVPGVTYLFANYIDAAQFNQAPAPDGKPLNASNVIVGSNANGLDGGTCHYYSSRAINVTTPGQDPYVALEYSGPLSGTLTFDYKACVAGEGAWYGPAPDVFSLSFLSSPFDKSLVGWCGYSGPSIKTIQLTGEYFSQEVVLNGLTARSFREPIPVGTRTILFWTDGYFHKFIANNMRVE